MSYSAPDNHLTAGPDCRVKESRNGRISRCWSLSSYQCSGLYRPPVFKKLVPSNPPQTIISLPVQTAACEFSRTGRISRAGAVQASALGLYLPPVFKGLPLVPPQTIISLPVQTAVWNFRAPGALVVVVASSCPCSDCNARQCSNSWCYQEFHPRQSSRCRSKLPCGILAQRAHRWCWSLSSYPCWDCIARRCSNRSCRQGSAPDDHLTARPNRRVPESRSRRIQWY